MDENMRNEKDLTIYIGKKIKEIRTRKKMKQKDLAQKIKKSANTVSNYENGIIAPSQDALFALADALDVKIDNFFPGEEKDDSMHIALRLSDVEKDIEQMQFVNNLIEFSKSLNHEERAKLMDRLGFALDVFKKEIE